MKGLSSGTRVPGTAQELLSLANEIDAAVQAGTVQHVPQRRLSTDRPTGAKEPWSPFLRYLPPSLLTSAVVIWLWNLAHLLA